MPGRNINRRDKNGFTPVTLAKTILLETGVILTLVGKPFYFLFTTFLILFLILSDFVGKIILNALISFWRFSKNLKTVRVRKSLKFSLPVPKPKSTFFFKFKISLQVPKLRFSKRIKILLFLNVSLLAVIVWTWFSVLRDLPRPGELITRDQAVTTKIYDRKGQLLFKVFKDQNRTLVKLEKVPLQMRQATIAIEDADFYSHPGFSLRGIVRSFFRNVTRGELTGGSTITQQLVKNALLSPEKTFIRKIKEIVLAIQVELSFSKDQILEMYLNEVSYGSFAYGIEEATQLYFRKHAQELTLAESALLAGLPKAPTTYSPFGANPNFARARQLEVLSRMVQQEYITQQEADEAAQEKLVFAPQRTDIQAPHFVMYIKQLLAEKYGEHAVEQGGLDVITSLDLDLQQKVQEIVYEEAEKVKRLRISNGAAMVTNPNTGEILAMVGSKNYFDPNLDGNFNVTTALRQPGSSIKPVNYSYAFEKQIFTPASLIEDSPITYFIPGSEPYSPRNYDSRFHGKVPIRTAFGSSYNVPAVKILASYGVDQMVEQGKKLGITTWDNPRRFGLSLTLGGGEVKMIDMAAVYGTFANYGNRVELNPILKVTNYKNKVLEENKCTVIDRETRTQNSQQISLFQSLFRKPSKVAYAAEATDTSCGTQVLDPRTAFLITDILKDNNARAPAFGPNSLLFIPSHSEVAVKTGTTQNLRDNWAIGYTKDYVVATWVGNNDNTSMLYVASGITGATPIWHNIMKELLEGKPNHDWPIPSGIREVDICPTTGTLPCEGCGGRKEYFIEGTEPTQACIPKPKEENQQQSNPTPEQLPEAQSTEQ